jgi:pimeloyl-ACP methyl ester carboxylesterase
MQPVQHYFTAPNPPSVFKKDHGTHNLSYFEWGDEKLSKVALCVHGLTRNARDFDYLAQALAGLGYRVIALEMAGRGDSDYLSEPSAYCYELYCADVTAFMQENNLANVDFIGTSMGGLIGMMLAAADVWSKKPSPLVGRLMLNDIGYFIPKESLMRIGLYVGVDMEFQTWQRAEDRYREVMQSFGIVDQEHWQHVLSHAFEKRADGSCCYRYDNNIAAAFWKNGKQIRMPDMDLKPMWDAVNVPTFLIRGMDSDLLLRETYNIMLESDNVQASVEFGNVGHAPMLMSREQIDVLLSFLA